VILIILKFFINYTKWIDELDAKVDDEIYSLYVTRIGIEELMGYAYIVWVGSEMNKRPRHHVVSLSGFNRWKYIYSYC
jgi:hypothetical protein